jgi:hypothetical protein
MNMGNGRVYYCRLGRAANLGKVGKESSEVLGYKVPLDLAKYNVGIQILTRKRPLSVSRLWRSTALCVARRSAVLARREGLRLP